MHTVICTHTRSPPVSNIIVWLTNTPSGPIGGVEVIEEGCVYVLLREIRVLSEDEV
jgi:hypothetical protein